MAYQILTPAGLRADYATLTDKLIHRFESKPDVRLLFLDKSARPVAWLVKALWPVLARRPGTPFGAGEVPPMPSMSFANIDREQWWSLSGASETGVIDVDLIPASMVAGLRAAYLRRRPASMAAVWDEPSFLDSRSIVVVDEVRSSGDTLTIATGLVRRAFPTATVDGTHWMISSTVRVAGEPPRIASTPVWYRNDTPHGRLVGNRADPAHRGRHWRGDLGTLFLSTTPPVPDRAGITLRTEVAALAADLAAGRLLALPAPARLDDEDDFDERIRRLSGRADLADFEQARRAQRTQP